MTMPPLPPDLLPRLIALAAGWVRDQQDRWAPGSRPLSPDERAAMAGFFAAELLDSARLAFTEVIEGPPFLTPEVAAAFGLPPELTAQLRWDLVSGIVFDQVILISARGHDGRGLRPDLLFHELIHVAQYRLLGLDRFMDVYVRGFLKGGYFGTPPEEQAWRLTARFSPGAPWPVEAEVAREWDAVALASFT